MNRRDAIGVVGLASLGALSARVGAFDDASPPASPPASTAASTAAPPSTARASNPISLAQWSLHRRFGLCRPEERPPVIADAMDFAKIAKSEFGLTRVEYVNQFYSEKIGDSSFARELRTRSDDQGVRNELIMCDGEGLCGAAEEKSRAEFASNHLKWLELAQALGCHSIRVNAIGEGDASEQIKRCADGLTKLLAVAKPFDINVIVENHGGLSSDGAWVVEVMKAVNDPRCGTLPDFGNWRNGAGVMIDPVRNLGLVLPYAKGVSAKSYGFDANGDESLLNYPALMELVAKSSYRGAVGIEYEGRVLSEADGIHATKKLLQRLGCVA